MAISNNTGLKKAAQTLAWYNMIPNLFWSALNLAPVSIYCFSLLNPATCYIFLALSSCAIFLKHSFLNKIQAGETTRFYRRLGVHHINKVAQNGAFINSLVKKKFPGHKVVTVNRSSVAALIRQTYVFEKFHWILFLFFGFTTIDAVIKGYWIWTAILVVTNLAYNIYPNLLQQYIRLKLVSSRNRILQQ